MGFINIQHLKVLLLKDMITLWRNKAFIAAFVIMPVGLMLAFSGIQGLIDKGTKEGPLIYENFFYISTPDLLSKPPNLFKNFQSTNPNDGTQIPFASCSNPSNISTCSDLKQSSAIINPFFPNQLKYYYNSLAIVCKDQIICSKAKQFFEQAVLFTSQLNITVETFIDQKDLLNRVSTDENQPFFAGIVINEFNEANDDKYNFTVFYPKEIAADTNQLAFNDLVGQPDLANYKKWFDKGQSQLFAAMNEFIARIRTGQDFSDKNPFFALPLYNYQIGVAPMRSEKFSDADPFGVQQLSQNFPLFMILIYIMPAFYCTTKLAQEKESKAREGMKMMGLNDATYYFSWVILNTLIVSVTSLAVTIVEAFVVLKKCDFFIMFLFNLFYGLTFFGSVMLCVAILPTRRNSGIGVILLNFLTFFMGGVVSDPSSPSYLMYLFSFFPQVCMAQMCKEIFFFNYQTQVGLKFSSAGNTYAGFSFGYGLLMLFCEAVSFTIIGLYLDQIIPSQFGVAKPWNFCCVKRQRRQVQELQENLIEEVKQDPRNFEQVPDSLLRQEKSQECLKVSGLFKKFGDKFAVNGTDLTMYNGQIFALLGHNGAGKTTTISMLTGLLEPTAGKAEVFGLDIFNQMEDVRKVLGVCPQHDVLFDFLTPTEHLRLFASFKGTDPNLIEEQVQQMLEDIDLVVQKNQISKNLSAGQKRKLSVAISMIGNSKIVMLDEPSSGMDTSTRRRLWDMLKKNKAGKIVILTTHYMDEADILGDRIAIMAEGKVQCTGSSLFLKNRYGVGYNLVIAKKDRKPAPQVDKFVLGSVNGAKKLQEVSSEITYQLPTGSSSQFKQFFADFDENLDKLGIRSYSVGITTLEEVFLKIGHGEELEAAKLEQRNQATPETPSENPDQPNNYLEDYSIADQSEQNTFFQHLYQLMRKKLLMQFRDRRTLFVDLFFPNLLIIAGLWLSTIQFFKDGPVRSLSPYDLYQPSNIYYNTKSKDITDENKISDFMKIIQQDNSTFYIEDDKNSKFNPPVEFNGNLTAQAEKIDEYTFNKVQGSDQRANAAFYIQNLDGANQLSPNSYQGTVFVNSTSQEVAGSYVQVLSTAFLKQYLIDKGVPAPNMKIHYEYQPFPLSAQFKAVATSIAGGISGFLITIAYLMISDSQVQSIIRERERNIKHQIMVSGASKPAYWLGHYIGDVVFQFIPCLVSIVCIEWIFKIVVPYAWVLFIINVFTNSAFIYALSFFFEKEDSGSLTVKMIYFIFGIIGPIVVGILQIVNDSTKKVGDILQWFGYPIPIYSLSGGYKAIANKEIIALINKVSTPYSSFDKPIALYPLLYLIIGIPFYWFIVFLFERNVFSSIASLFTRQPNNRDALLQQHGSMIGSMIQDNDIQEEAQKVMNSDENNPTLVKAVQKKYGNLEAVKNVSFGLEFGECFALLGVSGAGKTTLFKCLTGEIRPSSGKLTIQGYDVSTASGFQQARKQIGYCPQFDCIFENITVKEHLEIYATLKGVKRELREQLIQKAIKEMDLTDFVNIAANNLSGGNKRKLSVAIATIGNPPLVFLDEPSTGVDPQAKRFMWNILSKISTLRKKSAVIITTHSMEEAEALCTKMGIMVAGEFRCFGTSTHIKDKFGTGYELEFKIRTLTEEEVQKILYGASQYLPFTLESFKQFLVANNNNGIAEEVSPVGIGSDIYDRLYSGVKVDPSELIRWQFTEQQGNNAVDFLEPKFKEFNVLEHYGSAWKIKVSRDNYSIGYLFGMMEDNQANYNISEYSVAQTTLEQIFNQFAMEADQKNKNNKRRITQKTNH